MTLAKRLSKSKSDVFLVDENCFSQTLHIIETRAKPLGIEIKVLAAKNMLDQECFGAFLQYPDTNGVINNYSYLSGNGNLLSQIEKLKKLGAKTTKSIEKPKSD